MERFLSDPIKFGDAVYKLNPLDGSLIKLPAKLNKASESMSDHLALPQKAIRSLEQCQKPYNLRPKELTFRSTKAESTPKIPDVNAFRIAQHITFLCKLNFMLARIYAWKSKKLFSNASEAVEYYRMNITEDQDK